MSDDLTLLGEYVRHNSEEAFSALVSRHINLVYSVALRQVGDEHLAQEVTQVVFIILSRKAGSFDGKIILPGWLCRTARYAAANALTLQRRRAQREQEAYMQSVSNEPEATTWMQIAPLLDGALAELGGKDHDAIVLRFLEGRSLTEVGIALGASEDAAKKRVNRALEKLRRYFSKRGVVATSAVIAGAVAANSVQAAPAALATTVAAVAFTQGTVVTGTTSALIKGTLKLMIWTKTKIAVVGMLLAATVITPLFMQQRAQANLREENQVLREQLDQKARLAAEQENSAKLAARKATVPALDNAQFHELIKLRGEVGRLRRYNGELERMWAGLKAVTNAPNDKVEDPSHETMPQGAWKFAGYGSPEATLMSIVWAESQGRHDLVLAAGTPGFQEEVRKSFAEAVEKEGKPLEEIIAENKEAMKKIDSFRIVKSEVLADDQMLLHLHTDGVQHQRVVIMKKMDNEWKIDHVQKY